jgi:hypothetical protein
MLGTEPVTFSLKERNRGWPDNQVTGLVFWFRWGFGLHTFTLQMEAAGFYETSLRI